MPINRFHSLVKSSDSTLHKPEPVETSCKSTGTIGLTSWGFMQCTRKAKSKRIGTVKTKSECCPPYLLTFDMWNEGWKIQYGYKTNSNQSYMPFHNSYCISSRYMLQCRSILTSLLEIIWTNIAPCCKKKIKSTVWY